MLHSIFERVYNSRVRNRTILLKCLVFTFCALFNDVIIFGKGEFEILLF
jgi:hypothetical protein